MKKCYACNKPISLKIFIKNLNKYLGESTVCQLCEKVYCSQECAVLEGTDNILNYTPEITWCKICREEHAAENNGHMYLLIDDKCSKCELPKSYEFKCPGKPIPAINPNIEIDLSNFDSFAAKEKHKRYNIVSKQILSEKEIVYLIIFFIICFIASKFI